MPELTREEKLKLVEKLPQQLQDFLYSEDTGAFLLYLGNKYGLPDEKISTLSKIIFDIIAKITPITSLAQEIADKVISDHQMAMAMAQELNGELLAPVLTPVPDIPAAIPALPTRPERAAGIPTPAERSIGADRYREPMGPEVIDLRKTPPPPMPAPVVAAPIPPIKIPATSPVVPVAPKPVPPLTFTKPVEKTPMIEADPHKISAAPMPLKVEPTAVGPTEPQLIIRPPGLPPAPNDVLDLRQDK